MLANSRFQRIARDLEKLPCELHEAVLADLEFEQLVRLSHCAGERLAWSLENSLSSWGIFFKNGDNTEWQRLLSITDMTRTLCFALPSKKGTRPYEFEYGPLSFLNHRRSDWSSDQSYARRNGLLDREKLSQHWLQTLNQLVLDTTWQPFHHDYDMLIEPWLGRIPGAIDTFERIPSLSDESTTRDHHLGAHSWIKTAFELDEMTQFVNLYQRLRLIRAKTLSKELLRLADLYEAHPDRLKEPFAPQIRPNKRPFNPKHVPGKMRHEAKKMVRRARTTRWTNSETCKYHFRFPFPAIVPFGWCAQLFNEVVPRITPAPTQTIEESPKDSQNSILPFPKQLAKDSQNQISAKCTSLLDNPPSWATKREAEPYPSGTETDDQIQRLVNTFAVHGLGPKITFDTRVYLRLEGGVTHAWEEVPYKPHSEEDLAWLEGFAEVTRELEGRFPNVLGEIRGVEWDGSRL